MVGVRQHAKKRTVVRYPETLVEEVRVLHEELGWSYSQLARWFAVPKATIQCWLNYRRR